MGKPDEHGIRVARFQPRGHGVDGHEEMELFVTAGLSALDTTDAELVLAVPGSWEEMFGPEENAPPAKLLRVAALAHVHKDFPLQHLVRIGGIPLTIGPHTIESWLVHHDHVTQLAAPRVSFLLVTPLVGDEAAGSNEEVLAKQKAMVEALSTDWGHLMMLGRADATRFDPARVPAGSDLADTAAELAELAGPGISKDLVQALLAKFMGERPSGPPPRTFGGLWSVADTGTTLLVEVAGAHIDLIIATLATRPVLLAGPGISVSIRFGADPHYRETDEGNWSVVLHPDHRSALEGVPAGEGPWVCRHLLLVPPFPREPLAQARYFAYEALRSWLAGSQQTATGATHGTGARLEAARQALSWSLESAAELPSAIAEALSRPRIFDADDVVGRAILALGAGHTSGVPDDPEYLRVLGDVLAHGPPTDLQTQVAEASTRIEAASAPELPVVWGAARSKHLLIVEVDGARIDDVVGALAEGPVTLTGTATVHARVGPVNRIERSGLGAWVVMAQPALHHDIRGTPRGQGPWRCGCLLVVPRMPDEDLAYARYLAYETLRTRLSAPTASGPFTPDQLRQAVRFHSVLELFQDVFRRFDTLAPEVRERLAPAREQERDLSRAIVTLAAGYPGGLPDEPNHLRVLRAIAERGENPELAERIRKKQARVGSVDGTGWAIAVAIVGLVGLGAIWLFAG